MKLMKWLRNRRKSLSRSKTAQPSMEGSGSTPFDPATMLIANNQIAGNGGMASPDDDEEHDNEVFQVKTADGRTMTVTATGLREGAFSMTPEELQKLKQQQEVVVKKKKKKNKKEKISAAKESMAVAKASSTDRQDPPIANMALLGASAAAAAGAGPSNIGQQAAGCSEPLRAADAAAGVAAGVDDDDAAENGLVAAPADEEQNGDSDEGIIGPIVFQLLGDRHIGKTKIVRTFSSADWAGILPLMQLRSIPYNCSVVMPIGAHMAEVQIYDQPIVQLPTMALRFTGKKVKLHEMARCFPAELGAFVICYSTVDRKSLENAKAKWAQLAIESNPLCPVFLLGTKRDLRIEMSCQALNMHLADDELILWVMNPYWVPSYQGFFASKDGPFVGFTECSDQLFSLKEAFEAIGKTTLLFYENLAKFQMLFKLVGNDE